MHASIEQLLNLRDAAPEASDVAGHVNGCQRCQAELGRLRIVQVGLQSLPEIPAPEGSWEALSRKRPGKGSAKPMVFTGWFWTGSLAAALAVAVVLFGLLNQVPRGPESGSGSAMSGTTPVLVSRSGTETAGSAAKVGDMAQLMARSQQLEQVLRAMPEGPQVVSADTAGTISVLEDRVAMIDYRLSMGEQPELSSAQLQRLWQERVDVMNSLVQVRYAQAQRASF
jgi:hypothetical protein